MLSFNLPQDHNIFSQGQDRLIRRIMGVLQKYGFTAPQFLLQQSEPGVHLCQGQAAVSRFGFSYTYLPDL